MGIEEPNKARKRVATMAAGVLLMIVAFTGLLIILNGPMLPFGTEFHITYPDYEAMVDDGALERGWVPDFVPESSTDFEESHNLDTNRSWMRFSAPTAELDAMLAGLEPISGEKVTFPRRPPGFFVTWWPADLTGGAQKDSKYAFYRCNEMYDQGGEQRVRTGFLAVERGSNTVWHWRP